MKYVWKLRLVICELQESIGRKCEHQSLCVCVDINSGAVIFVSKCVYSEAQLP